MFIPSCTLRRRAMEAGAAAVWPGFALAPTTGTGHLPSWSWLVLGVGFAGLALAGWSGWKRRRRETAADRHWRRVLEKTDSMVWEAEVRRGRSGLEWEFTFVQPSRLHKRLLGVRRLVSGEPLWPGLDELERVEMDRRSAEAILAGETGYEREFRVQADGCTYWLHEMVAIEAVGAERWRLTAVVSDTTARHEADEARRQSEQRLERLAAEMHALLWQARVRRRATGELAWELFVPRSELYRSLFGEEPGDQPQLRWAEAGVPELETIDANARAALLEGRAGYEQVFHVPRPRGDIWLREQVAIRPLGSDEWALTGVVVDVTQQRQAEERRREEESQLLRLLSAANCLLWRGEVRRLVDGTFLWDAVTSRSVLYQQLFGDPPAGTPCRLDWRRVAVPENDEMDARATAAVLGGAGGYTQDFRVLLPHRVLWLHEQVTITPIGADAWRLAGVVVDISARREAEEAQRSHQTQLASILRAVDCMLWQARVIDAGGGALHWTMFVPPSGLYREIFGEDPSNPTFFRWERVVDAATDRQIDNAARRAILGGQTGYMQEFRALAADGKRRWLHEQVAIEPVGKGEWNLVGVVTDATPRHAAEEAKREHERQLERIFSVVDCLLWRAEVEEQPGGEFVWLVYVPSSGLYHKLFGPGEPDPRTALNWDRAGVVEYPAMNRRSAAALRSGAPGYEQEFRAVVDGRPYWLLERVSIRRTAYNRFELVGVIVDVSNQKRAEAELAAEKERLAVTLRAMAEGVVTTDLTGRVQFINPAAAALTQWATEEAVGRPLDEICRLCTGAGAQEAPVPLAAVLRGDAVVELPAHAELLLRDGERRFVEGCCAPIHAADSSVTGAVLVFRDVTERERLEQELGRASKLESVGLLAGGIAHDFNNILTAVLGNLALGLLDVEGESELGHSLREAERAALRARDLTQQLLTFARGGDPVRAAVRLPEILTEATRFALHGAKVKAEFDLAPDLWPADVDKAQIGRVVQNLVINAVQAMPGGGTVRIVGRNRRIEAGELPPLGPGAYLQIAVSDTGSGIKPEHLARVFEPYFTTKQTGSGLGLATVYSIVRKHKGHVAVESTLGRGSTFIVHLPAAEHGAPVAETTTPAAAGALRARVLFMDDEAPIRQFATALLRRLGCEVEVVADGAAAVERYSGELAAGQAFDVVVMDLTIPGGMGGLEALERIRAVDPRVRAIVSSGYSSDPVLANYRDYGFSGRVAKPYEFAEFGRVLREVLGGG
ncbi:MAG TPA: PAS domain S-box protein [Opitutaceae bacterium]|nr:PAS domain S-box protein [Opitutaceae bacterium]